MKLSPLSRALAALTLSAALAVPAMGPAFAEDHWHGRGHGDWHHERDWHHGGGYDNTGAIVGGALLALGLGAAVGALAAPPQAYAPPPPVYYPPAPPPAYYAPPPAYYGYGPGY